MTKEEKAKGYEWIGDAETPVEAPANKHSVKYYEPNRDYDSKYNPTKEDIKINSEFGTLYEEGDTLPENTAIGDVKEVKSKVKGVSYSVLYMKAVKALQEAMTRIETLETKVKTLEDA